MKEHDSGQASESTTWPSPQGLVQLGGCDIRWVSGPGSLGKIAPALVCWAGTISRASVFPLFEWRKIKLRNAKQHLLSYCCQIYILASSATQGGNVPLFSSVVQIEWLLLHDKTFKTSLSPCSQNSLGSFWIHGVHISSVLFHLRGYFIFFSMMPSKVASYHQWSICRWLVLFPIVTSLCHCPPASLLA